MTLEDALYFVKDKPNDPYNLDLNAIRTLLIHLLDTNEARKIEHVGDAQRIVSTESPKLGRPKKVTK